MVHRESDMRKSSPSQYYPKLRHKAWPCRENAPRRRSAPCSNLHLQVMFDHSQCTPLGHDFGE